MVDKKVAISGIASKSPEKKRGKMEKIVKYINPFSFTDPLQQKFVNCIMKNGKKTVAQKILQDTFDEMNRRGEKNVFKSFEIALKNSTPLMEVRAKRIGGAVYQIPIEVTGNRQQSLSTRWILEGARSKKGQPMFKRLATELIDCANETGFAFGKKEDSHRMAQANKAFAHLARY
ncbi:30S ribosomal protein S7 [Candidatus Gracilibacteria bacterium]|nr:30S ribosomal protein S7 [Candidatus Gracilibacteria bacterium]